MKITMLNGHAVLDFTDEKNSYNPGYELFWLAECYSGDDYLIYRKILAVSNGGPGP